MKRIIALFLALCVMIPLVSCDVQTGEKEKVIVNFNGLCEVDFENGTLHRFCPLKGCKHNDKTCPFYEMYSVKHVGDDLYYLQDGNIRHYNMKTGEYGSLYTSEKNLKNLFADENNLFFTEGSTFMKFDLSTREAESFCENIAYFSGKVYAAGNGKVYYRSGTIYYSVDYNGKNIIKGDKYEEPQKGLYEAGNWALSVLQYQSKNLISINLDNGSRNMILQKVDAYACYNGKIIYSKTDDSGSTNNAMNRKKGILYMCNPDGTAKEILCDISGLLCSIASEFGAIDAIGSGDWIAVKVLQYDYNSNFVGYYYDENPQFIKSRYIFVNMVTGEFKFAKEV